LNTMLYYYTLLTQLKINSKMEKTNPRKVISVKEFRGAKGQDLVVEKSKKVTIGPGEKEHGDAFHLVQVNSLGELQELGILNQRLDAEKLLAAVKADDEEAADIIKKNYSFDQHDCGCKDGDGQASMQSSYSAMRKKYNPNLTKVLSTHNKKSHRWDDLEVAHTRHWVTRFTYEVMVKVPVLKLKDIIVNTNGTLTVNPGTDLLFATDVKIYQGGKIMVNNSYLKIKCASIQGHL